MTIPPDAVEPLVLVAFFTLGCLLNRRPRRQQHGYNGLGDPLSERSTPSSLQSAIEDPSRRQRRPDNSVFRGSWTSRFLAMFPFLLEIGYWNLTYWVYQLARAYTAVQISGNEAIFDRARHHAISLLHLERRLGIALEQPFQDWILTSHPAWMGLLGRVYYSHICLGVAFIVYTYTYFPHALFTRIRRSIALNNWLAFVVLTVFRCMPPRMLPAEYGFVDVLHGGVKPHPGAPATASTVPEQTVWTNNRFKLTIAAMPSLHFGTAAFLGYCVWRWSPHRPLRIVAPFWPLTMLITIVGTANHFLLDAAVGTCIVLLGWRWNEIVLKLRPLEEWFFWCLRTERPTHLGGVASGGGSTMSGAVGEGTGENEAKDEEWLA